jgi:hypothetical protein
MNMKMPPGGVASLDALLSPHRQRPNMHRFLIAKQRMRIAIAERLGDIQDPIAA